MTKVTHAPLRALREFPYECAAKGGGFDRGLPVGSEEVRKIILSLVMIR